MRNSAKNRGFWVEQKAKRVKEKLNEFALSRNFSFAHKIVSSSFLQAHTLHNKVYGA